MIIFEGFELTNFKEIKGELFRPVYTEKDYVKIKYKKNEYYVLDPKHSAILGGRSLTNNPARDVHKLNSLPFRKSVINYYLSYDQLIEYMLGNYDYSIICCAYIASILFTEKKEVVFRDMTIFKDLVIPNKEYNRIKELISYVKLPEPLKFTIRKFVNNDINFPDLNMNLLTKYEMFRIRSHYIENIDVINNLEIEKLLSEYNNIRLKKEKQAEIRKRILQKRYLTE